MDTYVHKRMASVGSLEKIEIIRSQELMPSEVRQKFLKKMIILVPKTAILGPQFCRILVLGPHFWWSGGPGTPGPPWIRLCKNKTKLGIGLIGITGPEYGSFSRRKRSLKLTHPNVCIVCY